MKARSKEIYERKTTQQVTSVRIAVGGGGGAVHLDRAVDVGVPAGHQADDLQEAGVSEQDTEVRRRRTEGPAVGFTLFIFSSTQGFPSEYPKLVSDRPEQRLSQSLLKRQATFVLSSVPFCSVYRPSTHSLLFSCSVSLYPVRQRRRRERSREGGKEGRRKPGGRSLTLQEILQFLDVVCVLVGLRFVVVDLWKIWTDHQPCNTDQSRGVEPASPRLRDRAPIPPPQTEAPRQHLVSPASRRRVHE